MRAIKIGKAVIAMVIGAMFLVSCESQNTTESSGGNTTKFEINLDSSQVVLTNRFAFKDGRFAVGGASFLVKGKKDTYLCTAKHLLGEPMGISPKIPTQDFEKQLDYWTAYAYDGNVMEGTISVDGLVNEKASLADILLLNIEASNDSLLVLNPRFSKPKLGTELTVIACEQGDEIQRKFPVVMDEYNRTSYIVRAKKKFNPQAMSGSPVVDENGMVVGVLVGGGQFEGELYLTVEPLRLVKAFLQ